MADLNFEAAVETAKEIQSMGRKSKAYKMDVANFEQVQEVVNEIKSDMNRSISLLVNNAAKMNTMAQMKDMTYEMWQTDINVNLTGTFNVTKAVWDDMRTTKLWKNCKYVIDCGYNGWFWSSGIFCC